MTRSNTVKRSFALFVPCLLFCLYGCTNETTSPSGLVSLTSWKDIQTTAIALQLPVVVLVEQRHCGFCQALKREVIQPLAEDAIYARKAIYVSVLTDFDSPLIEKDGEQISGFEFAQIYDATTTPTILFLNASASELQERVVGYNANAAYVENVKSKIESSIGALH